jgi:RimJ/RimL family protein N-acetyltransferase
MGNKISLRDVKVDDLQILFEQERDPVANLMAAYPSKDEESFMSVWKNKIRDKNGPIIKAITCDQGLAGSIECWEKDGKWLVGYWIGRDYWGKGIGTAALRQFLMHLEMRPLYAYVGNHNKASIRVLEKCGFTISGHGTFFSEVHGHDIKETIFICK